MANAPDRFELFLLGEGQQKVTQREDTRTPNTSYFVIEKEDHTIGNLIRMHLVKHPEVIFAAYRVPHPLVPNVELRVQTTGKITPKEAVQQVIQDLLHQLSTLGQNITREFELKRMAMEDGR